jgi:DNA-binding response OmpR family regulator
MVISNTNRTRQFIPVPSSKPRLLLVSDSAERLRNLQYGISDRDYEINSARSLRELRRSCSERYDLVALDVPPGQIAAMLKLIRMSAGGSKIPIFVECDRISDDTSLAGVLPSYRAMPCHHIELLSLLRHRKATTSGVRSFRSLL